MTTWPTTDREWARSHVGCNVTTCPNSKCQATGECKDAAVARQHVEISDRHVVKTRPFDATRYLDTPEAKAAYAQELSESPPLAPTYCTVDGPEHCAVAPPCGSCPQSMHAVESPPLAPTPRPEGTEPLSPAQVDKLRKNYKRTHGAPRTIIAFTGLAGSGKTTAARHLFVNRGFERVRFAGPLKAMMAALGLTTAEIDGDRKELPCALLGGKTPRWAMQSIGTEWGRNLIDNDLWIRAWQAAVANVPAGLPVVVDDCRFPNEAAAVTAAGGILVRIDRPGVWPVSAHSSESFELPASRTLHNTRDMQSLREQVDVLLRDLSWTERHAYP